MWLLYLRLLLLTATKIICFTVTSLSNLSYFISIAFVTSSLKGLYQLAAGCLRTVFLFPFLQCCSPERKKKDIIVQDRTDVCVEVLAIPSELNLNAIAILMHVSIMVLPYYSSSYICSFSFPGYSVLIAATSLSVSLNSSAIWPSHSAIDSAIRPRCLDWILAVLRSLTPKTYNTQCT